MKAYQILILLSVFLIIPSVSFAEDVSNHPMKDIETGDGLYQKIKSELSKSSEDSANDSDSYFLVGYICGFMFSLETTQEFMYGYIMSQLGSTESERESRAKELNLKRVNLTEDFSIGQIMVFYKKWAEEHPERLNDPSPYCLFQSILDTYGWK